MIDFASKYGRYGYKRITALLNEDGWRVNHKRVFRIWREEGLKVPSKQPKKARLWLGNGDCVRHRSEHKDHVWSYDFVHERTKDNRSFRILTVIGEFTRESLATVVRRKFTSLDVIEVLSDLFVTRGLPKHIRSDNGPEFTLRAIRQWLHNLEVVLVNTSFNVRGEPIVCTPVDAFNCFMGTEIEILVIGNCVLRKEQQSYSQMWCMAT